jgi:hypothetical protein
LPLLAAALSCPSESEVDNPSGSCSPNGDGARTGYHDPGDSKWLPDCKNPLAREYYRVFTQSSRSAYLIPRVDGSPALQPICADEAHALHPLVTKHLLCVSASGPSQVERVNDMLPADALAVAHFLHGTLRFSIGPGSTGISPSPFPSDILDACALPAKASPELAEICERERDRLRSGNDLGFSYEGPGAVELVTRLNDLYAIE